MKKRLLILLSVIAAALIAGNLFLILKSDSKIQRSAYVNQWEKISRGDLKETFKTEGVVTSSEEHYVYFDEEIGSFNKFLVKEGDQVKAGDPLFEYDSFNIDDDKRNLEADLDKAEDQIESIEDHIDELRSFISVIEAKGTFDNSIDESKPDFNIYGSVVDVEKEIYNKELEKELLEKEAALIEKQIDNINDQSSRLKVMSNFDGTVTKVKKDLSNPVVIIQSNTNAVKGFFDEKEVAQIETGMPAFIYPTLNDLRLEGFVSRVIHYPEKEPSLKDESLYPFYLELNEESKDLYPGIHTGISIVTNELKDTVIIPSKAAKTKKNNTFVYLISPGGSLLKQKIEPGIKVNNLQEVKKGLEGNEFLALSPSFPAKVSKTEFITPIKTRNISKKSVNALTKKEIIKYTFTGFIRR
ncbi:efflux RND transporter periplasmic adaptor subunit [Cytobacillus sp.]|uniref:efflux RND transporter periplasmic adaptor subunit n=1 Tax=Cytobacillus sp. TaxID=2675269 RepID=UPI003515FCE6